MGLDITAYRQLKPIANPQMRDGEPVNYDTEWLPGSSMEWSEREWPGRGAGVEARTVYTWADRFSFRAGSYSGYNQWRRKLVDLVAGHPGDPFAELINFADNEGVIGPVVSAKLAADFVAWESRAHAAFDEWEFSRFQGWKRAFEMAADDGAVDFH